jgi:hypothetical protein
MAKKKRKPHQTRVAGAPQIPATEERSRSERAERKELLRQEREQMRKRVVRRRVIRGMMIYTGGAILIASVFLFLTRPRPVQSGPLPGMLTGKAPWPANTGQLAGRLDHLGLPTAGISMHIHAELEIFVDGKQKPVPADIGIASSIEAPLRTKTADGVIHVESETPTTFRLGQFFDVWGVRLTGTCLGGYCNEGSRRLRAYVDGEPVQGGARAITLDDHSVIVLTYGTRSKEPSPIPSTFDWSTLIP